MAVTTYGVGDALTAKRYSREMAVEALMATEIWPLVGEDEDSVITLKTEPKKEKGDRVTVGLLTQLTGDGRTEGQALEGSEESLTTYSDNLLLNELNHAVRVKGKNTIDDQRILFDTRAKAKKLLKDWFDYSLTDAGLRAAGFTLVATACRPVGGWLADRVGGAAVLTVALTAVGLDAVGLAWQATDPHIIPVTIFCLTMAGFLGLGNGAVFKMVPQEFPETTGGVTGIVGAAGGLGGFFPPLVMGVVKDATGAFTLGFVFLVAFAWVCALQAQILRRANGRQTRIRSSGGRPTPASETGISGCSIGPGLKKSLISVKR